MYPRDELIARHYAHGKCGAVRFALNPVAVDEPIYDEQGKRRPRHAALRAKANVVSYWSG